MPESIDNSTPASSKTRGYPPTSPEYAALRSRIRHEFDTALGHSLFLPHTYLKDVSPRLHQRAIDMSRECVAELEKKFLRPKDEHQVDDVLKFVIPGFGTRGTQLFLKIGLCVTILHDEIGWCSALNYMTVRSRGCALWIGLNMHKASAKWSKERLRSLINARTFSLTDFIHQLKRSGLQPSMQLQYPGTCIYSPQGRGSAHIVITIGSWVEQIAINDGLSPSGLVGAMHFWDGLEPLLHNSALATRPVIPLMWLQEVKGWKVGMEDQLRVMKAIAKQAETDGIIVRYRDYRNEEDEEIYCKRCFGQYANRRAILFMQAGGYCPSCFVDHHPTYLHFASMIDRQFK